MLTTLNFLHKSNFEQYRGVRVRNSASSFKTRGRGLTQILVKCALVLTCPVYAGDLCCDVANEAVWKLIKLYGISFMERRVGFESVTVTKVSVAARMWWRTLLLVLLTALHTRADDESQLQVGKSINIFSRYGYLSLSMKVVSRNDTDWVFREPTLDIFTDLDSLTSRPKRVAKKGFQGDFYVEFCDDLDQLFQAYFREFTFERLNKPWKAFTASWSKETVAKSMGINSSFVQGEYCYALVRLSRFRDSVALSSLPRNIRLAQTVSEEIDGIRIGDVYSVFRFIQKFGTHYINSFVTGNSLYQVFVYTPSVYRNLKNLVKQRGLSNLATPELANYFSPWQAEHMGSIKAASGNKTIESWAAQRLRLHHYIFTYPSLFKIRGDGQLMRYLNEILGDEAILEMNMRTVAPAFKDPAKRKWFNEVLDNYMSLWDVNL